MPVLNDVAYDPAAGLAQFDVSRDGTMVYRGGSGGGRAIASLRWLDATGKQESLRAKPAEYIAEQRLSPDGKRIAMQLRDGASQDIWIYDIERDAMPRLTFGGQVFVSPVWSPDGRYVVFGSIGNGLFWTRADGGGRPQALLPSKSISLPFSFSPDGKRLAYHEVVGTPQIWTVPIENGDGLKAGKPERYLTTQFVDSNPMFSPDGRWLAYQSSESGTIEVYVRAFPSPASGQGGKWQISNGGGANPAWSPNGREILYRSGDQVMSVGYTVTGDSFVAMKPRVWLKTLGGAQVFDLAPDGQRLLVMIPTAAGDAAKQEHTLVFLQNFFDELRRRVPVDR